MTLADAWACFRAMAWLVLCSLLLALPACSSALPQAKPGPALSAKAWPQRIAHQTRPVARTAHAVVPAAATVVGSDEKERLFRDFVEWQGAQGAAR